MHPNLRIKSTKLGMSHTVHCFIPAAYTSLIKYEWPINSHPKFMKFYRETPLGV